MTILIFIVTFTALHCLPILRCLKAIDWIENHTYNEIFVAHFSVSLYLSRASNADRSHTKTKTKKRFQWNSFKLIKFCALFIKRDWFNILNNSFCICYLSFAFTWARFDWCHRSCCINDINRTLWVWILTISKVKKKNVMKTKLRIIWCWFNMFSIQNFVL